VAVWPLLAQRGGRVLASQNLLVQGDRIAQVGPDIAAPAGSRVIHLSRSTVQPSLIDNQTHVLLQAHPTDYDEQLIRESIGCRTIRATASRGYRWRAASRPYAT
jgi:imidazolonepropionase-like amidohydrolase